MENPIYIYIYIDYVPIKTSISRGFPIAMFDYRRVHPDVQVSAIPKTTDKQHVTHHIQEVSAVSAKQGLKHHVDATLCYNLAWKVSPCFATGHHPSIPRSPVVFCFMAMPHDPEIESVRQLTRPGYGILK